jgi:DNA-binding NarL/FixJ family response regulator
MVTGGFPPPPIRTAIIGHIRVYRDGVAQMLERYREIEVVAVTAPDRDGLGQVGAMGPDIALIEEAACQASFIRGLTGVLPEAKLVALGVLDEEADWLGYAEMGMAGYVPKEATAKDLVMIVLAVANDEFRCSPKVTALLLRRLSALAAERRAWPNGSLTLRQREVIMLIDEGLSNKEIARRLGIELSTVKNHVHQILQKLHAQRRSQAAAHVRQPLYVDHGPRRFDAQGVDLRIHPLPT